MKPKPVVTPVAPAISWSPFEALADLVLGNVFDDVPAAISPEVNRAESSDGSSVRRDESRSQIIVNNFLKPTKPGKRTNATPAADKANVHEEPQEPAGAA